MPQHIEVERLASLAVGPHRAQGSGPPVTSAGTTDAGGSASDGPPRERPLFSVIIPTRNRSALFAVALSSVLEQRFRHFEVIVVNDGSDEEHAARYRELVAAAPDFVQLLTLIRTARGHGQSYGLNYGAAHARGDYFCFLDDDDQWIDPEHLGRAAAVVAASPEPIDLVLANQQAFRNGTPVAGVVWIEDLKDRLHGAPNAAGAYAVTPEALLQCQAHCHLNTTIVARDFYADLGGLDEGLRYECDRDFYLRALDRARLIKFLPCTVSRHNIPDPAAKASMSTTESELSKRLYQLRVCDKAVLLSVRPELQRYAMRHRSYILKHIAVTAARMGRFDCAAYYAREALMTKFTLGWLAATALFAMRRQPVAIGDIRSAFGNALRHRRGCPSVKPAAMPAPRMNRAPPPNANH